MSIKSGKSTNSAKSMKAIRNAIQQMDMTDDPQPGVAIPQPVTSDDDDALSTTTRSTVADPRVMQIAERLGDICYDRRVEVVMRPIIAENTEDKIDQLMKATTLLQTIMPSSDELEEEFAKMTEEKSRKKKTKSSQPKPTASLIEGLKKLDVRNVIMIVILNSTFFLGFQGKSSLERQEFTRMIIKAIEKDKMNKKTEVVIQLSFDEQDIDNALDTVDVTKLQSIAVNVDENLLATGKQESRYYYCMGKILFEYKAKKPLMTNAEACKTMAIATTTGQRYMTAYVLFKS